MSKRAGLPLRVDKRRKYVDTKTPRPKAEALEPLGLPLRPGLPAKNEQDRPPQGPILLSGQIEERWLRAFSDQPRPNARRRPPKLLTTKRTMRAPDTATRMLVALTPVTLTPGILRT